MVVASLALPPSPSRGVDVHLLGRHISVADAVPLGSDPGGDERQRILSMGTNLVASTDRALLACASPVVDGRGPFVRGVSRTTPPNFACSPGNDVLRNEPVVPFVIPFLRNFGVHVGKTF